MNSLGADILRLWVAAADYRNEMTVSDEIFNRTADSYRRMRNTARFLLSNLDGFEPTQHKVDVDQLLVLDRWVIDAAACLQDEIVEAYDSYQFHVVYQKLHNFCVNELGGFYLDVIKDRQYTTQSDSLARRSAQTAMHYIIEAFTRWIAPILSFTADELWAHIPGEREEFVFVSEWAALPKMADSAEMGRTYWRDIMAVKNAVNKQLESARKEGIVGASLAADITLYCDGSLAEKLSALGDELRFVLMTSTTTIKPLAASNNATSTELEGLDVAVSASAYEKCDRCWHHSEDVGSSEAHPLLCGRCESNVDGEGEKRLYA